MLATYILPLLSTAMLSGPLSPVFGPLIVAVGAMLPSAPAAGCHASSEVVGDVYFAAGINSDARGTIEPGVHAADNRGGSDVAVSASSINRHASGGGVGDVYFAAAIKSDATGTIEPGVHAADKSRWERCCHWLSMGKSPSWHFRCRQHRAAVCDRCHKRTSWRNREHGDDCEVSQYTFRFHCFSPV